MQTNIYKVNGANRNSLVPIGMTTCTLEFPKKFQQQFIVCKHLLWPVILGLDFSHNYLIGIDWFSSNQLHLHQGLKSIVISDPAPFPLHVNQISTLPPPHILIKTVAQVPILPGTLAIVPVTFNNIPKPDSHYSFMKHQSHTSHSKISLLCHYLKIISRQWSHTWHPLWPCWCTMDATQQLSIQSV